MSTCFLFPDSHTLALLILPPEPLHGHPGPLPVDHRRCIALLSLMSTGAAPSLGMHGNPGQPCLVDHRRCIALLLSCLTEAPCLSDCTEIRDFSLVDHRRCSSHTPAHTTGDYPLSQRIGARGRFPGPVGYNSFTCSAARGRATTGDPDSPMWSALGS